MFFYPVKREITLPTNNIIEPNHEQNDHHIKLVLVYQNQVPWLNGSQKLKNAKILTKGRNFVKIMTTQNL